MTTLAHLIDFETWKTLPDSVFGACTHHLLDDIEFGGDDAAYLKRRPENLFKPVLNTVWWAQHIPGNNKVDFRRLLTDEETLQALATGQCVRNPALGEFLGRLTSSSPLAKLTLLLQVGADNATPEDVVAVLGLMPLVLDEVGGFDRKALLKLQHALTFGGPYTADWDHAEYALAGYNLRRTILNFARLVEPASAFSYLNVLYRPFTASLQSTLSRLKALTQPQLVQVVTLVCNLPEGDLHKAAESTRHMRSIVTQCLTPVEAV